MHGSSQAKLGADGAAILNYLRGGEGYSSAYAAQFNSAKKLIGIAEKKAETVEAFLRLRLNLSEQYSDKLSAFVRDADDEFDAKPQEDHNNDVLLYMEYLTLLQNQLSATDSPKSDDVKCLERCMARLSKIKDKTGPDVQYCAEMATIIRDSQLVLAAIAYNYGADALNRSSQTERKNFKAYDTAVVCFKKSASAYRNAGETKSAVETEVMLAKTYENYADELFDKKDEKHLLAAIENYQAALKHYPRDGDGKKEFSIKMRLSILNARAELAQQYFASKHYQLALEQTGAGLELYNKRMKALHPSDDDYPETCELLFNLSDLDCKSHAELYKQQQSLRTDFAAKLLAFKGKHDLGPPLTWGLVEKRAKATDSELLGKRKTSSGSAPPVSEAKKAKSDSAPSASEAKKGKSSSVPASEAKKGKSGSVDAQGHDEKGGRKEVNFANKKTILRYDNSTVFYKRPPSQNDDLGSFALFGQFLELMGEGKFRHADLIMERFCVSLFCSCQTAFQGTKWSSALLVAIEKYVMSGFPGGIEPRLKMLSLFGELTKSDKNFQAIQAKPFSQHALWGAERVPASLGQFVEGFCAELDTNLMTSGYELRCQQLEWFRQKLIENLEKYRGSGADAEFNQLYDSVMSSFNPALEQERANTATSSAILNQL